MDSLEQIEIICGPGPIAYLWNEDYTKLFVWTGSQYENAPVEADREIVEEGCTTFVFFDRAKVTEDQARIKEYPNG